MAQPCTCPLHVPTPMRANVRLRLRTAMQMCGCLHACRKGYAVGGFFLNASCAERLRAPRAQSVRVRRDLSRV
eukprot:5286570-Prymnesium_polylepis.3